MVPVPPLEPEGLLARPIAPGGTPRRLVIVRLHAFGDTVLLFPLLAGLAERFPKCRLEVVTGPASADLFRARADVHAVHVLDARTGRLARYVAAFRLGRALRNEPLDALLDLQRSRPTRLLRLALRPRAFGVFDRFAPRHALERYLDALEACGLPVAPVFAPRTGPEAAMRARSLLAGAGRDSARPLVILNPAGGWETKQWPLEKWVALGRALVSSHGAQLLFLGSGEGASRVAALAKDLEPNAIDLTGRTTPAEAMALVAECAAAVSEDSGLVHLAWTQGVPTVALFGATRSTWSRPAGPASSGFYSEDLPCGACMTERCARGDVYCLTRISVEDVLARVAAALRAPRPAAPLAG
jgi:ADP-heptose:LPS heptosyltransferase